MRPSLRFLALALVGWAGVRAATLGMLPGSEGFTLSRERLPQPKSAAGVPPVAQTEFAPLEPPQPAAPAELAGIAGASPLVPLPAALVQYYPVKLPMFGYQPAAYPLPSPRPMTPLLPEPEPQFYSRIPQLDEWPLSRLASASLPAHRSTTTVAQQSLPPASVRARIDRLQLTSWALLRGRQGMIAAPNSLAAGGTLGGSQAGARLTYNVTRAIAASLRASAPIGARGGEVAAGIRLVPLRSLPVAITAERRQRIGRYGGGRSAFALFAEAGLYQRPIGARFSLDAYAQGGVVGARSRDWFVDGGFTLSRPLFRNLSGGVGVWGGAQPGLYRLDAGPRLSMEVRRNVRVHLDWRQRLAGNAEPGSGPALTLSGDF